ncbi:MAG TPA: SDR family NAD(P)-dependent oxidoreductase [Candidatus Methylomirabilis sp.]|nr:SDR family NAD(P)-dependent oxidoreductase [Candidatus Methylomirabilis sp.]
MFDFTDQVVLVTGAGAGIGFAIARAFHEAGARVGIGDLRAPALERAASRLGPSGRVHAGAVDVRDAGSVADFVEGAERALGAVTVAVANAGIYPNTPVLDMPLEEWDRVMETNVRGVFLTCQAAARAMVARGTRGRIITISSGAAQSGRVGAAHYCASKAGVVMFTKVLALELASHRINVNSIAPGLVEVEGEVSPVSREYVEALVKQIPWGRAGRPEDIAHAALFLASPLAEFITGEVLAVNGGSAAGRAFLPLSSPRTP